MSEYFSWSKSKHSDFLLLLEAFRRQILYIQYFITWWRMTIQLDRLLMKQSDFSGRLNKDVNFIYLQKRQLNVLIGSCYMIVDYVYSSLLHYGRGLSYSHTQAGKRLGRLAVGWMKVIYKRFLFHQRWLEFFFTFFVHVLVDWHACCCCSLSLAASDTVEVMAVVNVNGFVVFICYLSVCLSIFLSVCMSVCLSVCSSVCLYLTACPIHLSVCSSIYSLSPSLFPYLPSSSCLSPIPSSPSAHLPSHISHFYLHPSFIPPSYLSSLPPLLLLTTCFSPSFLQPYIPHSSLPLFPLPTYLPSCFPLVPPAFLTVYLSTTTLFPW